MIYDSLKDVLKHTHGLGFLDTVKLVGTDKGVTVESLAEDRSVVLRGSLNNSINGLEDETIGLTRMSVLNGYINFSPFAEDDAEISIKSSERNGEEVPSELSFKSAEGHKASYRFMAREVVEENVQIPPFKGAEWDIVYKPTAKNLTDLAYFSNILGSYEPTFSIHVEEGNMSLAIGSSSSDRSLVPFATGIDAESFNSGWKWPLTCVLSILKLGANADSTMYLSSVGALRIEIDSGLGTYEYILPARR